eukprot:1136684-Amphidinium_carterae.1
MYEFARHGMYPGKVAPRAFHRITKHVPELSDRALVALSVAMAKFEWVDHRLLKKVTSQVVEPRRFTLIPLTQRHSTSDGSKAHLNLSYPVCLHYISCGNVGQSSKSKACNRPQKHAGRGIVAATQKRTHRKQLEKSRSSWFGKHAANSFSPGLDALSPGSHTAFLRTALCERHGITRSNLHFIVEKLQQAGSPQRCDARLVTRSLGRARRRLEHACSAYW